MEYLDREIDPSFGGKDFDKRLMGHVMVALQSKHELDFGKDAKAMKKLGEEVVKAKLELSS